MARLIFSVIFSVIALLLSSLSVGAAPKPNVILILADDLGYGDLSSYGATDLKTPHIDQLVEGGMRFSNFYANCPVCSPTRAALLSGKYQDPCRQTYVREPDPVYRDRQSYRRQP